MFSGLTDAPSRLARTARRVTLVASQVSALEVALAEAEGTALETTALEVAIADELGIAGADELAIAELETMGAELEAKGMEEADTTGAELEATGAEETDTIGAELEATAELVGSGSSEQPSSVEVGASVETGATVVTIAELVGSGASEQPSSVDVGASVETGAADEITAELVGSGASEQPSSVELGATELNTELALAMALEETTGAVALGTLTKLEETTGTLPVETPMRLDDATGTDPVLRTLVRLADGAVGTPRPLEVGRGRQEALGDVTAAVVDTTADDETTTGVETTTGDEATAEDVMMMEDETIAEDDTTGTDDGRKTAEDETGRSTGLLENVAVGATEDAAGLEKMLEKALTIDDEEIDGTGEALLLKEGTTDEADADGELAGSLGVEAGADDEAGTELAEADVVLPDGGRLSGLSLVASAQKAISKLTLSPWQDT